MLNKNELGWATKYAASIGEGLTVDSDYLYKTEGFWGMHFALYDENVVIVKGKHFRMGQSDGPFKGFGGALFSIKFHDGREVDCRNLWMQGDIPEEWRDRLPDNAVFTNSPFVEE